MRPLNEIRLYRSDWLVRRRSGLKFDFEPDRHSNNPQPAAKLALVGRLGDLLVVQRPDSLKFSLEKGNYIGLKLLEDKLVILGQWRLGCPPLHMRRFRPAISLPELTLAAIQEALGIEG
jgi:hypothetical protein